MGDRCTLNVDTPQQYADRLKAVLGEPDTITIQDGMATLEWEEANHGLYSELVEATAARIPFDAFNGPGDSYGPGAVASFAGDTAYVAYDDMGRIVVPYPVKKEDIENADLYISLQRKVKEEAEKQKT